MDEKRLSQYIDELNAGKKPKEHKNHAQTEEQEDQELLAAIRKVRTLREIEYPDDEFQQQLIDSLTGEKPMKKKESKMKKYAFIYTTAAAILLLFAVYQFIPNKDTNIVFAMEKAMQQVKAYHGIVEVIETNALGETMTQSKREIWADQEGKYYVRETEGTSKGLVTANNGEQKWQLRPDEKTAYRLPAFPDSYRFTFELGNEIEDVTRAQTVEIIGSEKISGREATKLQITPEGGDAYFLWIDKEMNLPLQRVSAMQNAIQIKVTYSSIEFIEEIPEELLMYGTPDGYKEVDANTEQIVTSLEEAEELVGFMPKLPEQMADGYTLKKIAVEKKEAVAKLYYTIGSSAETILLTQAKATAELATSSMAILGTVNDNKAEIITAEEQSSIRWQEDGMEYCVMGDVPMQELVAVTEKVSEGKVVIPESTETENEPQIKVEVDQSVEENEQKSVDAGHSPWKLDPAYVTQVFASLLLSPEGIVGDYPIAYENIEITTNNGVDAVAEIKDDKSIAKKVYLKRLVRQDDTGIWTVIGYDPA